MIGRRVDRGLYALTATAILLAFISFPIRPLFSPLAISSPGIRSHHGVRLKDGGQPTASAFQASGTADAVSTRFKDELEADIEDESIPTSLPAPASALLIPAHCFRSCSDFVSPAVAVVVRPLRC